MKGRRHMERVLYEDSESGKKCLKEDKAHFLD